MKPKVYIETTIPSYLTGRSSRDLVIVGHPIVEEVREARRKQAEKFQFDLRKIFADAKSRETTSGNRLVSFAGRSGCIAEESADCKTKQENPESK